MKRKQTAVEYVVQQFGGVRATARALGIAPGSVSNWKVRSSPVRKAGSVPSSEWSKILKVAEAKGLDIKINHLL